MAAVDLTDYEQRVLRIALRFFIRMSQKMGGLDSNELLALRTAETLLGKLKL